MVVKKYAQNRLDWDAGEALSYLYGATHMVLVVAPLCDAAVGLGLAGLLAALTALAFYRLKKGNEIGGLLNVLPSSLKDTLRWLLGLSAATVLFRLLQLPRLKPDNEFYELIETLCYLAVMIFVLLFSLQRTFMSRYQDVVRTEYLESTRRNMLRLYYAVLFRIMLHENTTGTYLIRGLFFAYATFQTSLVWSFGFQPAKFS